MNLGLLKAQKISLEQHADICEGGTILQSLDLGNAITHHMSHPTLGNIILINTSGGESGYLHV